MAAYDVSDVLPVDEVEAGTNLLVGGPPLTSKRELAMELVNTGCERGDGAVVVSTHDGAESIRQRSPGFWDAVTGGRAGVVDCVSRQRGERVRDEDLVKYVASPGDITDVGIRVGGIFQHLDGDAEAAHVNVSTISTMLMYADRRRVFRFLHVFSVHVERLGWLGVGVLDTGNREAFDAFAPLYDGMVQTRDSENGRELRVVGLGSKPTEWVAY